MNIADKLITVQISNLPTPITFDKTLKYEAVGRDTKSTVHKQSLYKLHGSV
jgi:hypothetical protein